MDEQQDSGIRAKGEEALSDLAHALAENPILSGALARALGAGERAAMAQQQAIGALSIASAADVQRLEQRVRSLASRLEATEDALDDLRAEVASLRRASGSQG